MFGLEFIGYELVVLVQWLIVFALNIVPALAPPTWAVLSFFYISRPQDIIILVAIGVSASACGRFVLAKLSEYFTTKFASTEKKHEFMDIERNLRTKGWEKFVFAFLYSLSPLPSNAIFIAFGATKTRLREVLAGFIVGRTISYLFLIYTTEKIFSSVGSTITGGATIWTILIELIGVGAVVVFFLFDWSKLIRLDGQDGKKKKGRRWAHIKK
ncbi:MAG: VTT domain-containing protein [archaeon]